MKIKKLKFEGHEVLGDLEIDFTDENGKPLEIVAFIGDNGTGKTKILEEIVIKLESNQSNKIFLEKEDSFLKKKELPLSGERKISDSNWDMELIITESESRKNDTIYYRPSFCWIPAELNFNKSDVDVDSKRSEYAEEWNLEDINEYITARINKEIYKDMSKPAKVAFDSVSKEVNDIFEDLNIGIKMIGLSGESGLPTFINKQEKEIELKDLSSGEKQLFFRMLHLKALKLQDAIIIIDEPETSLHPEWQRKIIDVYKNIGENNQIILATHSPLIIGSVPSESVRIMSRNNEGKIEVNHAHQSYGKTVDYILNLLMGLKDLRDVDTARDLKEASQMLKENKFDEYEHLISILEEQLGSTDKDVMRLEFEKAIKVKQNAKNN